MSRRKQSNPKPIKYGEGRNVYENHFDESEIPINGPVGNGEVSAYANTGSDKESEELGYSSDPESTRVHREEQDITDTFNSATILSGTSSPALYNSSYDERIRLSPKSDSTDEDGDGKEEKALSNDVIRNCEPKLLASKPFKFKSELTGKVSPNRDVLSKNADAGLSLRSTPRSNNRPISEEDSNDSSSRVPIPGRKIREKDLASHLQLPSDVLYLQKEDINIHGTTSVGWIVCSDIPLPQGSSLGPFQGQQVSPDTVKVGDLIIQLTNKRGQQVLINVAGQSGGWLALLRTPTSTAGRNTHVYLEGNRIWCEIVADVEVGTELRASFSFHNEEDDDEVEEWNPRTQAATSGDTPSASSQPVRQQSPTPGHAALIYGCPFCGVRFSSPRTLQGHLSFYCSKKSSDRIVTPGADKEPEVGEISTNGNHGDHQQQQHLTQESSVFGKQDEPPISPTDQSPTKRLHPLENHQTPSSSEIHPANQHGENQSFQCKFCSYTAEKLSSLNRHMRIHKCDDRPGPSLSFYTEPPPRPAKMKSPSMETFCKDCRIQFSSIRTYRCHKDHYCAQRQKKIHAPIMADASAYAIFPPGVIFPQAPGLEFPAVMNPNPMARDARISISDDDTVSGSPASIVLPSPVLNPSLRSLRKPRMTLTNVKSSGDIIRDRVPALQLSPSAIQDRYVSCPTPVSRVDEEDSSGAEPVKILKDSAGDGSDKSEERDNKDKIGDTDDHPLDLTIGKKSLSSPTTPTGVSKEQLTMKQDYQDPKSSSPSTPASSFEAPFIKIEPGSRSPLPVDQVVIRRNRTLSGNNHDLPAGPVGGPNALASISETTPPGPIPIQLLRHSSLLVPPIPFLPAAGMTHVPSTSDKIPIAASGISKCNDCNIVFYKHENYLVHKQYYCSGNRLATSVGGSSQTETASDIARLSQEDVLTIKPERTSAPVAEAREKDCPKEMRSRKVFSPNLDQQEDVSPNDVKYKYYCVPCRIKFSNASILAAHKEYYCPAGKDSEQSIVAHASNSQPFASPSPDDPQEASESTSPHHLHPQQQPQQQQQYTCTKCRSIFASARLLRLHLCDGGFPCPHCDHLAVTENRLAEHVKVHAPTRAFRCTICGYRGNTARGMRMHGKTHIDEGIDFTDENMLEYHEPAIMPVIPTVALGQNSDSELLRIKNEPYKRRRSRKAYEKFDYPQAKVDIPQICSLCGQSFPNAESLGSHFKVHEIAATQYLAGFMKCIHCDYVGRSPEDLRSHFEINHGRKNNRKRARIPSDDDDENRGYPNQNHDRGQALSAYHESGEEPGGVKVIKRESPTDDRRSSPVHRQEHHRVNDRETRSRDLSDPRQDITSMIPTTVKEEEGLYGDGHTTEQTEHANFLNIANVKVKVERVSPPAQILFPSRTPDDFRATQFVDRHSSSRDNTPDRNSSPASPRHSQASFRRSPTPGTSKDNFLVNIKKEVMDLSPSPGDQSKASDGESRQTENHINGLQNKSPDRPISGSMMTSQHNEDRPPLNQTSGNPRGSPEIRSGSSKSFSSSGSSVSSPSYYRHPMPCFFIPPGMATEPYHVTPVQADESKRYCQHCDIYFSRHATYLAHKKHYCRGVVRSEKQPFVHA